MREDFNFDARFYERKPAIAIAEYRYSFVCEECGQPGESTAKKAKTHEGACREARRRRQAASANERLKRKRAKARAAAKG